MRGPGQQITAMPEADHPFADHLFRHCFLREIRGARQGYG
jgi:hypothetical protein